MARASTTPTTRTDPAALPSRIGRLLGEVRWFLLLAVTIAFLIILLSYNRADPGFTHASQVDQIRNLGGRVGAWLADLLLFVFGASAYWWEVPVSYTHLTLPTIRLKCRSRWSPYH